MKKLQDYNIELLDALHSWFWYNGLLEQDGDKWVDFENISRPKYDENCLILKLITILREDETESLEIKDLREKCNIDMYYDEELNVLWLLLVEMFGEYGTSPRSGWIEKRKECADFLETIVEIEELKYERN